MAGGGDFTRLPEADRALARTKAKAVNFGAMYGMGAATLRKKIWADHDIAVSLEEAQAILGAFHATYPAIRPYQRAQYELGRFDAVWSIAGRPRRALWEPERRDRRTGELLKPAGELWFTDCCNHRIQSSAADVLLEAMVRVDRALPGHAGRQRPRRASFAGARGPGRGRGRDLGRGDDGGVRALVSERAADWSAQSRNRAAMERVDNQEELRQCSGCCVRSKAGLSPIRRLRTAQNGNQWTRVRVAVDTGVGERAREQRDPAATQWVGVRAFREQGNQLARSGKGTVIYIEGKFELPVRTYTARTGEVQAGVDVIANRILPLGAIGKAGEELAKRTAANGEAAIYSKAEQAAHTAKLAAEFPLDGDDLDESCLLRSANRRTKDGYRLGPVGARPPGSDRTGIDRPFRRRLRSQQHPDARPDPGATLEAALAEAARLEDARRRSRPAVRRAGALDDGPCTRGLRRLARRFGAAVERLPGGHCERLRCENGETVTATASPVRLAATKVPGRSGARAGA